MVTWFGEASRTHGQCERSLLPSKGAHHCLSCLWQDWWTAANVAFQVVEQIQITDELIFAKTKRYWLTGHHLMYLNSAKNRSKQQLWNHEPTQLWSEWLRCSRMVFMGELGDWVVLTLAVSRCLRMCKRIFRCFCFLCSWIAKKWREKKWRELVYSSRILFWYQVFSLNMFNLLLNQ